MTYFGVMDCEGRMRFAARNMAKVKKAVTAGRQNADLCSVLFRLFRHARNGTKIEESEKADEGVRLLPISLS